MVDFSCVVKKISGFNILVTAAQPLLTSVRDSLHLWCFEFEAEVRIYLDNMQYRPVSSRSSASTAGQTMASPHLQFGHSAFSHCDLCVPVVITRLDKMRWPFVCPNNGGICTCSSQAITGISASAANFKGKSCRKYEHQKIWLTHTIVVSTT